MAGVPWPFDIRFILSHLLLFLVLHLLLVGLDRQMDRVDKMEAQGRNGKVETYRRRMVR